MKNNQFFINIETLFVFDLLIMSGHSKWHKIQHKKGKADKARSANFTKLLKAVTVAAQEGGGDIEMNFSLRLAVQKAKEGNVPKDNIERAIKRGTGEASDGVVYETIMYEGYGPQGVAMLVEALTDNRNRAASDIKHAFSKYGGSVGNPGSVQWQFTHKALLSIDKESLADKPWEDIQLALMDAGATDIIDHDELVQVSGPKETLKALLDVLESQGIEASDSGLAFVANDPVETSDEVMEKVSTIIDVLDELDDVKQVYTNIL